MMKLQNVKASVNYEPDPLLAPLLEKLALALPLTTFTASSVPYDIALHGGAKPSGANSFFRHVSVACNGQSLGRLEVERVYRKNSGYTPVFQINSPRIKNERGPRNESTTSKEQVALALGKKVFAPYSGAEFLAAQGKPALAGLQTTLEKLRAPIIRLQHLNHIDLQRYLNMTLNYVSDPMPTDLFERTVGVIRTDWYQQSMREYELATEVKDAMGLWLLSFVVAYGDGVLISAVTTGGISDQVAFHQLDKLPEKMQNSIAVLNIVKDNEVVRDVGYKFNNKCMFVYNA
jgi:hypothetical protein